MTNAIPLIVTPQGDGTGRAGRLPVDQYIAMLAELTKGLTEHSVLAKGADTEAGVAGVALAEDTLLGRVGSGPPGPVTAAQISQMINLIGLLAAKSNVGHSHPFGGVAPDIDWSTLEEGRILARKGSGYEWIDPAAGGGTGGGSGVQNPLSGPLDIGGHAIVSGSDEVISFHNGKVHIAGQELLAALIESPVAGHAAFWDASEERFSNRFARPSDLRGEEEGKLLGVGAGGIVTEVDPPTGSGSGAYAFDGENYFLPNLPATDPNVDGALWANGTVITRSAGPAPGAAWSVAPAGIASIDGTEGAQDFAPTEVAYTIANDGTEAIGWSANIEAAWVSVSPASGTLAAGQSVVVTITAVQAELASLAVGTITDAIVFIGDGVANITRDLEINVAAAGGGANRAAVFINDAAQYGLVNWAPSTQDYTIKVRAKFTGSDDSPIFGGDIYTDIGWIRKSSAELQFWIDGAAYTTTDFALSTDTYYVLEIEKVGTTITFKKDGVATGATAVSSNTVPTVAFAMRIGAMISGSVNPMEGSIDYIEFIDPADNTRTAVFSMNGDDFSNSHPSSTVPDGSNVGGITFEDV